MVIAPALLDDVVAHAREEYDAECCGMIAYEQSEPESSPRAVRVHRAKNVYASRKRFEIDGREVLRAINEFDAAGWEMGAIYHSHTHTEPYPSQTDINFAAQLARGGVGDRGARRRGAGGPLLPDRGRRGHGGPAPGAVR